jgi:hypothetical protein
MSCHCFSCGQDFGGERAFDLHRRGPHAPVGLPSQRRCLTAAERELAGLRLKAGVWYTHGPKSAGTRRAAAAQDGAP